MIYAYSKVKEQPSKPDKKKLQIWNAVFLNIVYTAFQGFSVKVPIQRLHYNYKLNYSFQTWNTDL